MKGTLVITMLALTLWACGSRRGMAGSELLQLVPEDAAVVVTTAGWADIRARGADNHWVDLAGGATWDDLSSIFRRATQLDEDQGFDLLAAMASIQGRFAAYARFQAENLEPEFGIVVQTEDATEDFGEFFARFSALAGRNGSAVVLQHAGARVEVISHREETVLFSNNSIHGMTFAPGAGGALAAAKGILDRHAGQNDGSVLDAPRFQEACADREQDPVVRLYLDGPACFALLREDASDRDFASLEQLGVTDMRWALAEFDLGKGERLDLRVVAQLAEESALGVMLSHMGPIPKRFARAVPAQAVQVVLGHVDLLPAFKAFRRFLREVSPSDDSRLQKDLDGMRAELGLDVEQDLLAPLTGRFAAMGLPVAHSGDQMMELWTAVQRLPFASLAFTFAPTLGFELRSARAADRALSTIEQLARNEPGFEQEVLAGVPVNRVEVDPLFSPHWGRYETLVFFSVMESSIRASLEFLGSKSRDSFADREGVGPALSEFRKASLLVLVRTRPLAEIGIGTLRAFAQQSGWTYGSDRMSLNEVRLPHAQRIADLFEGVSVAAFTRRADRVEVVLGAR